MDLQGDNVQGYKQHFHINKTCSYLKLSLYFAGILLGLSSCAVIPHQPAVPGVSDYGQSAENVPQIRAGRRRDVKHVVAPGETCWRISRMYDVPVAVILRANHITDPASLRMGQTLLIPGAGKLKPVINLIRNSKWRYIVIHHSATEDGSSLRFNKAHLAKGWEQGVGYHFVIDNSSENKQEGQIEQTPRWMKQQDGAHCKASDMNVKAIGICLVGNFNEDRVSSRQMAALVYLVRKLQKYYHIPTRNIKGHGHVPGAATDCPGRKFSWEEFVRELEAPGS